MQSSFRHILFIDAGVFCHKLLWVTLMATSEDRASSIDFILFIEQQARCCVWLMLINLDDYENVFVFLLKMKVDHISEISVFVWTFSEEEQSASVSLLFFSSGRHYV